MFVGREKELNILNNQFKSNKFEFTVIYGRRRVGKTAIINEFIKDKKAIYFTGVESNAKQNLQNLSQSILSFEEGMPIESEFSSFQAALDFVFKKSLDQRLILVIDEYPYVAKSSKSLASTLQLLIDRYKEHSKLFLILCGSSMSYMEDHVLAYKAPLYGRRTAQIKVQPFEFWEACKYFDNFSDVDKAVAYGVVGGTPQYLLQINDKMSLKDNIKSIYLNSASFLFEEPTNLLKQEVREPAIYNAIITAVANGASKLSEIASKVGEETSVCSAYIKNLISLEIIKKESPYGEKNSRKTVYSIEDNMFRFWYRFVADNTSIISRGADELAYKKIEPYLPDYMGAVFEEISKQYLWSILLKGECPVNFTDIGRWWGTNPKTRTQEEIDIVGFEGKTKALFAECKWTNEKVDVGVLEKLIERSNLFNQTEKYYYLFSKSGFTQGCVDKAEKLGRVTLVDYKKILKR
ncbi:MAG: ATP-binding protein [Acutalibacteraceae bacterium]